MVCILGNIIRAITLDSTHAGGAAGGTLEDMARWKKFPYDNSAYRYPGDGLVAVWPALHAGDQVPWPGQEWLQSQVERHPDAAPDDFNGDLAKLERDVQEAWRAFHRGDFGQAIELSEGCGLLAHAVANKAAGVYANYLATDADEAQACYMAAAKRAEQAVSALPDDPNGYYFQAFNLGRYSQSISIVKALSQGIGGRIQDCLQRALSIAPDHAEAHTAMGLYHAEIIDKVGRVIGAMTYGASIDKALEHFERAIELTPDSPIAHIEYGNGLYLLFGDKRLDEVTDLYVRAGELAPRDAMEKLDVEAALAELE